MPVTDNLLDILYSLKNTIPITVHINERCKLGPGPDRPIGKLKTGCAFQNVQW